MNHALRDAVRRSKRRWLRLRVLRHLAATRLYHITMEQ